MTGPYSELALLPQRNAAARRRKRIRNQFLAGSALIISVLLLIYGGRLLVLYALTSEADRPAASSIPLPTGSEIITTDSTCGSGGCSIILDVRPPEGSNPHELTTWLQATTGGHLPGNLLDPRTINLTTTEHEHSVEVNARFASTWLD